MYRAEYAPTLKSRIADFMGRQGTALLRCLPAETAHNLAMSFMSRKGMNFLPGIGPLHLSGMRTSVPGLGELSHPVGLAAGFDKNCKCPEAFVKMGLSFLELGTVTPRPQPGNPRPRMFRQPEQRAIINRMGFNSDGANVVAERLKSRNWNHQLVPLGINIGKNKTTSESAAIDDYAQVYERFKDLGAYYVINISSPNTAGLRDLATPEFIQELSTTFGPDVSRMWVKLDPDMPADHLRIMIESLIRDGFQGVILSNTHRVTWPEVGGQSGHPLMSLSNRALEVAHEVHRGALPTIASGGVLSGADILQKIIRGASAVQIYSALVYNGPWTVHYLLLELAHEMKLQGYATIEEAKGALYQ